jgi:hypothetical protein
MPYSKCPVCGNVTHLNVSDVIQWYADLYPGVSVGSLVPGRCFHCWPELGAGDHVAVRNPLGENSTVPVDSRGIIESVVRSPECGALYLVRVESGKEIYFIRAELRKVVNPTVAIPAAPPESN